MIKYELVSGKGTDCKEEGKKTLVIVSFAMNNVNSQP